MHAQPTCLKGSGGQEVVGLTWPAIKETQFLEQSHVIRTLIYI